MFDKNECLGSLALVFHAKDMSCIVYDWSERLYLFCFRLMDISFTHLTAPASRRQSARANSVSYTHTLNDWRCVLTSSASDFRLASWVRRPRRSALWGHRALVQDAVINSALLLLSSMLTLYFPHYSRLKCRRGCKLNRKKTPFTLQASRLSISIPFVLVVLLNQVVCRRWSGCDLRDFDWFTFLTPLHSALLWIEKCFESVEVE